MILCDEKRKLVEDNYKFVHWFIRNKKQPSQFEYDELVGEYSESLCMAIARWKPDGNRKLSNYIAQAFHFKRSDLFWNVKSIKRGYGIKFVPLTLKSFEHDGNWELHELGREDKEFETIEELEELELSISKLRNRWKGIVISHLKGESFKTMEKRYKLKKERIRQIFNLAKDQIRRSMLQRAS